MSLDSYLAYITESDNAELVAQTRLPALCDARVRAAFFAMTPPRVPGHGLYVLWEMIAGVRSQNRALRAEMVAHGLWRHGPGAAEWNARMARRRERLAAFSRSAT